MADIRALFACSLIILNYLSAYSISVVVSQLSYGSVDMGSGSVVDSPSETSGDSAQVEPLKCYNVQCSGEGCLYPFIRNITDKTAFTCTARPSYLCSILVESGPGGVSMSAGCGVDCVMRNISAPIVQGNSTDMVTTPEPGEETKKTTLFFEPRRRRRRDVSPREECCYTNYCNHDSPCGQLVCSTGFSTVANILLYMFLAVSLNKV